MNQPGQTGEGRLESAEERRLIKAAQRGCAASAHRLIVAHQDRLHAFVWRMLRNEHDSDEVCQEAFVRAISNLGSFDFAYRFSTWLFTIAYRLCLNQMRRRTDAPALVDFAQIGSPGDDRADSVGEAVANSDAARRMKDAIWEAVDELSPPQRATVLLFYREQLSCQQIGEVLEMPPATVKSHLHRARGRLREMLAGRLTDDWADIPMPADAG